MYLMQSILYVNTVDAYNLKIMEYSLLNDTLEALHALSGF